MELDDELETFIREHKARVVQDKASLDQDPPYMEMRSSVLGAHDSAFKENMPPSSRTAAPGKEEGFCLGLGVDYAKKKYKLQQELRMDYRRYMTEKNRLDTGQPRASVKDHPVPHLPSLSQGPRHPKRGVASSRDAAALTEDRRTTQGASRPLHRRTSHRESGEDDHDNEGGGEEGRLESVEGRRQQQRHMGVQAGFWSSGPHRAIGEKIENPAAGARADRRPKLPTNRDQTEFATGLLIGAADAEEALRKRQVRYRQELEEQIAEQQQQRRRQKELQLRVTATGAKDPEQKQEHIKYVDLNRRREGEVPGPYPGRSGGENPPPEPIHGAFQSPLLEYSAALREGLLSSYGQPGPPPLHRALDIATGTHTPAHTQGIPAYLPHPPLVAPEAVYRSQCHDACRCYSTRPTLDLQYHHPPCCGQQLPMTSGGFPASYWALPPGGSVSQFGHHSQYSGSHAPDPLPPPPPPPPPLPPPAAATRSPMRVGVGALSMDSVAGALPGDGGRTTTTKEKMLSYKEALKQQVVQPTSTAQACQTEHPRVTSLLGP